MPSLTPLRTPRSWGLTLLALAIGVTTSAAMLASCGGPATPASHSFRLSDGTTVVTDAYVQPTSVGAAALPSWVVQATQGAGLRLHGGALAGTTITGGTLANDVVSVDPGNGEPAYSSPVPIDAWVIDVSAPGQDGWANVSGVLILNAATQRVIASSILATN